MTRNSIERETVASEGFVAVFELLHELVGERVNRQAGDGCIPLIFPAPHHAAQPAQVAVDRVMQTLAASFIGHSGIRAWLVTDEPVANAWLGLNQLG